MTAPVRVLQPGHRSAAFGTSEHDWSPYKGSVLWKAVRVVLLRNYLGAPMCRSQLLFGGARHSEAAP